MITSGIKDLDLDLTAFPVNISSKIDITSFYIAYSNIDGVETVVFSNDSSDPSSRIEVFGFGVSNISVYCTKAGGSWDYSVALAMLTPCAPLGSFTLLFVLNGAQVVNGKFAVIKGTPPTSLVGTAKVPLGLATTVLTLCGTIVLGGSDFMNLIHSIVQLDSVNIIFIEGQELRVGIPATSLGHNLFGVFQVKSFTLDFLPGGFGLGADLEIIMPYLPGPPVNPSFSLVVMEDGAFGATITILAIVQPFGLLGVMMTGAECSLIWLAEAEEPQSMSMKAGFSLTEIGTDAIFGK